MQPFFDLAMSMLKFMKWAEKLKNSWTADERPWQRWQDENKVYFIKKIQE